LIYFLLDNSQAIKCKFTQIFANTLILYKDYLIEP